jgi:hypothetical protein
MKNWWGASSSPDAGMSFLDLPALADTGAGDAQSAAIGEGGRFTLVEGQPFNRENVGFSNPATVTALKSRMSLSS